MAGLFDELDDQIQLAAIGALEDAEMLAENGRQYHHFVNPLEVMGEERFRKTFRLSKNMARHLIDTLEPFLVPASRASALCPTRKVLTALRFYASGSYQLDIGSNLNLAVSQSSVSRCVTEVSEALNRPEIFNTHIHFPRNFVELDRIRNDFYLQHHFPGVVGCLDCTHVAIFPPKIDDPLYPEAIYVNRKGYHSINVQLICDSHLKIINVCARYPGSSHDSFIWNNSNVLPVMQNIYNNGHRSYYLLGDSGYALRPWLLTPLPQAEPNTPQAAYNERHKSTRSVIERCNGVLKLRFRCLLKHRVLHYSPVKAARIINACCVLHNMCIDNNIAPVELGEEDEGIEIDLGLYDDVVAPEVQHNIIGANRINPELAAGRRVQLQLIRNHFAI